MRDPCNTIWYVETNKGAFFVRAPEADWAERLIEKWHGRQTIITDFPKKVKKPEPGDAVVWGEHGAEDSWFDDGRPALGLEGDFVRLIAQGQGMSNEDAYHMGALRDAGNAAVKIWLKDIERKAQRTSYNARM